MQQLVAGERRLRIGPGRSRDGSGSREMLLHVWALIGAGIGPASARGGGIAGDAGDWGSLCHHRLNGSNRLTPAGVH
jgi:hypothetical protein